MVCPRCIDSVGNIFDELNILTKSIQLGEVITSSNLESDQKKQLEIKLISNGFELLQDQKSKLIGQTKTLIIEQIHFSDKILNVNFSTLLSEELNQEYSSLSRLFSSVEGITIERFIVKQKIEHVKELIFYNEFTLSEIAFQMGYSSAAHLSTQFKKETGMTPSEFRKLKQPGHNFLDGI